MVADARPITRTPRTASRRTTRLRAAVTPVGALLALAALLVVHDLGSAVPSARADAAHDDARTSQGAGADIFMPLAGRAMRPYHYEPVGTVAPPTPTRGPTRTPGATDTPDPTETPEASPMPTGKPVNAEEDNPDLSFTGSWRRATDARASGGAYNASSAKGDAMKVTFAGPHIAIYRLISPDGGLAAVSIDGVSYGDLTFYFFERRYQVPAVYDNLGSGTHTLTLTVSDRKPTASTGTNVYVDLVRGPSPFEPNTQQQQALARSNWFRDTAGLPRLRLDRAINLSAQAHIDYDKQHKESHYETQGRPGFTGARFDDRLRYFGYGSPLGEVMAWYTRLTPEWSVDGWMATVYHRLPFMDYASTDIGYGQNDAAMPGSVIDFGYRGYAPPAARRIITYPASGQRNVPYAWDGNEAPNPLPRASYPVGYPASMHIAQPRRGALASIPWLWDERGARRSGGEPTAWKLNTSTLTTAAGVAVDAYVIDQASDSPKLLGPDVVFVIGKKPLQYNTTYTVHLAGTDSRDQAFDHRWSFTTGQPANPVAPGDASDPVIVR